MALQSKKNILEGLGARIREMNEKGERPPWQKPWQPSGLSAIPLHNPATGNRYEGALNRFDLHMESAMHGYEDPRWMGFKQAKEQGWSVRKGEKATYIYVPVTIKSKDEHGEPIMAPDPKTGELKPKMFQAFKAVPVFNAQQIDGIPPLEVPERTAEQVQEQAQASARELDAIAEGMGVNIIPSKDNAFYSPLHDQIALPPRESFHDQGGYESTKAHEMAHATGHASRLKRNLRHQFGTPAYAFEEVVAEATAYTLCRSLNLPYTGDNPDMDADQHASYVAGWSRLINNEDLGKALDKAMEATSYLQNTLEQARERGLLAEQTQDKAKAAEAEPEHATHAPTIEPEPEPDQDLAEDDYDLGR